MLCVYVTYTGCAHVCVMYMLHVYVYVSTQEYTDLCILCAQDGLPLYIMYIHIYTASIHMYSYMSTDMNLVMCWSTHNVVKKIQFPCHFAVGNFLTVPHQLQVTLLRVSPDCVACGETSWLCVLCSRHLVSYLQTMFCPPVGSQRRCRLAVANSDDATWWYGPSATCCPVLLKYILVNLWS